MSQRLYIGSDGVAHAGGGVANASTSYKLRQHSARMLSWVDCSHKLALRAEEAGACCAPPRRKVTSSGALSSNIPN